MRDIYIYIYIYISEESIYYMFSVLELWVVGCVSYIYIYGCMMLCRCGGTCWICLG